MIRWTFASLVVLISVGCAETSPSTGDPDLDRRIAVDRRIKASIRTHPLPPAPLLDRVEAHLERDPCIRSLERWYRRYSYGLDHDRGAVDPNVVWFTLQEAGKYGFRAGRAIQRPGEGDHSDHRPYLIVFGTYYLPANRVAIEACGPNNDLQSAVSPGSATANMLANQR